MAEHETSGLDAVAEGPLTPKSTDASGLESTGDPSEHATVAALLRHKGDAVVRHAQYAKDQWVVWVDPARSRDVLEWLKNEPAHSYDMMSDVTGIDYGGGRPVEVVYQMYSTEHKRALRVRCPLPLDALEIDSVVDLWKSADWLEREVYDLFGVTFRGHPDLRRIMMPDDYAEGHPLRKDFPLRGRFSRAEQTRRALDQEVERYYLAEDLGLGDPQEVVGTTDPGPAAPGGGEI